MTYTSWCTRAGFPYWGHNSPVQTVSSGAVQTPKHAFPYNHLRVLGDLDTLALDDLDVVQTTQYLMLDLELGAHGELGAFLDFKGLVLEALLASRRGQVNRDGVAAGRVEGQSKDDADSGIVGVGNIFAAAQAEGLLVPLERFIAGIYQEECVSLVNLLYCESNTVTLDAGSNVDCPTKVDEPSNEFVEGTGRWAKKKHRVDIPICSY